MNIAFVLSFVLVAPVASVDFDNDVIPILTKAGCNTAACHGSAAGRGSFKLSLYGGNPSADYDAIVRDFRGRRIHHADPRESLLLAKPIGEMEHGGDVRLDSDGQNVAMIIRWIEEGASRVHSKRKLLRLEVTASKEILKSIPAEVQLHATAIYDNGQRRPVNDLAVFTAEDDTAIKVSQSGKATLLRRGRHNVHVRFLTEVVAVTLTAPLHDEPIDLADAPRTNFIDDEIYTVLEELRLPSSPRADEHTIWRRLRLDLTGRLPTQEEIAELDRSKLRHIPQSKIDALLASDEFTDFWTHQLGQWLRIGPAGSSEANARSYHHWLRDSIAQNRPLDEIATALVTSSGANGAANFYRAAPDARGQAEHFSEVMMGVRLRCANCHNHPLDRWTQDDYHGLAAIFAKLERGNEIRYIGRGEVSHPATGEAATPKLPGGEFLSGDGDQRQALARWLVNENNPQFARAIVNRLWHAMMGRGLVEPIDDFRATNPATHPRLLEQLTEDFIAHDYDLRHTLRVIATSASYARSSAATRKNALDDRYYSHALRKPLSAEVMLDAIVSVTDVQLEDDGLRTMRVINLPGPAAEMPELEVLGRCDRMASCSAAIGASNVTRELALLNGTLLNRRIASPMGRLAALLQQRKSNEEIVGEFYQRALSRSPTKKEAEIWKEELVSSPDDRRLALEDFLWSLLSCHEFTHRY